LTENRPEGPPRRLNVTFKSTHEKGAINRLAWAADGGSLIFASGGLWKVSLSGGEAVHVAETEGEILTLSASRQGRRVVYADLVPEVEIWRTAGPASKPGDFPPTRLIGSPDDVGSPNIARDGKEIAFGSFMSGSWEVWKCDREGRNPTQLSFLGDVPTGSPRWSPDGKFVVFDGKADDGLLNDIYVVDVNQVTTRRLTKDPSVDIRPCFSKDQRWVYFTSNRTGTFQIWKIPTEGGKAVQVTKNGGFIAFETPDGKYLYYGKGRGQTTLWRVPSGGGDEQKVLDNVDPSNFHVNDRGVVILNLEAKPRPAIEFYSFATNERTQLPVLPSTGKVIGSGTSISVAPDGRWIVYHQEGRPASGIRASEY
jgi:dipeptidyl aminopeptidase/acylaminoacyl peptidase